MSLHCATLNTTPQAAAIVALMIREAPEALQHQSGVGWSLHCAVTAANYSSLPVMSILLESDPDGTLLKLKDDEGRTVRLHGTYTTIEDASCRLCILCVTLMIRCQWNT